jgi:pimeloyl-ACP methyl ester carboxylesterase
MPLWISPQDAHLNSKDMILDQLQPLVDFGSDLNILSPTPTENSEMLADLKQHMPAGFEVFRAFELDAPDFAELARNKLKMPMLVLTGEKASGEFLIQQGRLVADDVEGVVIKAAGHWLMEEAPGQVIPKLLTFFRK